MHFTMLDGKVSNILSNTNSNATCYICGATPKLMNTPTVTKRPATIAHYRFGLSTLHDWIRCFECLLHISYRLPFKTLQVKEPNKVAFAENKSRIQGELKSRLGLVVDKPKPGYGSSNDGNTARRFFGASVISSEIDKYLINNLYVILRVINSGYKVQLNEFKILLKDTFNMYLKLYNWHYMPSSTEYNNHYA